jgi:hypothetical protein
MPVFDSRDDQTTELDLARIAAEVDAALAGLEGGREVDAAVLFVEAFLLDDEDEADAPRVVELFGRARRLAPNIDLTICCGLSSGRLPAPGTLWWGIFLDQWQGFIDSWNAPPPAG